MDYVQNGGNIAIKYYMLLINCSLINFGFLTPNTWLWHFLSNVKKGILINAFFKKIYIFQHVTQEFFKNNIWYTDIWILLVCSFNFHLIFFLLWQLGLGKFKLKILILKGQSSLNLGPQISRLLLIRESKTGNIFSLVWLFESSCKAIR